MLLSALLLPAALAQTPVLISRFEAEDPAQAAAAARVPELLGAALARDAGIEVLRAADFPWVQGVPGADHLRACPREQILGCTFALARAAEVPWAVTGQVGAGGAVLDLMVLDVLDQDEAWSALLPWGRGAERGVAARLAEVLAALADGQEPPIDEVAVHAAAPEAPVDPERALGDLDGGSGAEGIDDLSEGRQERPRQTLDELLASQGLDEPWRDRGLTPRAYLRWWNSGWGEKTWERLRAGRDGAVLVRGSGGWGSGPRAGRFVGQVAIEPTSRDVLEVHAVRDAGRGSGSSLGLGLGYGLSPWLEIEAAVGRDGGPWEASVTREELGGEPETLLAVEERQGFFAASAGLRAVPSPVARLRPVVGLGACLALAPGVAAQAELPVAELPALGGPRLWGAYALGGAELRLVERLDLLAELAARGFFAGRSAAVWDEDAGYLAAPAEAGATPSGFDLTLRAGLQVRL